ncbi:MAG: methylmalonyl-CoA mutase, large subunit, partial [Candidatus Rokubacteria bacterium]|nr:methylmalonyl-CoA mutase, large subunit [Candidatus Rokubacteria bacterium]
MTPEEKKRLDDAKRLWEARTLRPALEKSPDRPGLFAGSDGAPLERVYTPEQTAAQDYVSDAGFPGEHPYTRGVQP